MPGILRLFNKTYLAALIAVIGIVFLGLGVFEYVKTVNEAVPSASPIAKNEKLLTVDIQGAVVNPGVYRLPLDSRINDALVAASGFDEYADAQWVEKNINLAEKLIDGTKIYVPRQGENVENSDSSGASAGGLININKADSKTLESLPGIGPVTAGKIIDGRPYGTIEELSSRKIVSSKVYSEIKDSITAN